MWGAQINTCFSICKPVFIYTTSFPWKTNWSWRLFSAVLGFKIFLSAQNVTVFQSFLCRSRSTATSLVIHMALFWSSLFSVLIIRYQLNLTEVLCIIYNNRGTVVGVTTRYGLDGPGIELRWARDFLHLSRVALGPTQPPIQWLLGLFSEGKAARAWSWPPTLI